MKDGVYIYECNDMKQVWLVKNCTRKVLKDYNINYMPKASGLCFDLEPHNTFVYIHKCFYQFLRPITDEDKLELL